MTTILRNGQAVLDPRLGRIPELDERSRDYPVTKLLTRKQLELTHGRAWGLAIWLDQLSTSGCTGHSATYDLAASPSRVRKPDGSPLDFNFADALFHLAQRYD